MNNSEALKAECKRQEENCLYTSTSLFLWLRSRRNLKAIFIVAPLLMGGFAGLKVLSESESRSARIVVSVLALGAGVLPSIFAALKFDDHISNAASTAAEFKNLQDRFRQLAEIQSLKPYPEFESAFGATMQRLEEARQKSITPPERFFKKARRKIQAGHYQHDSDTP